MESCNDPTSEVEAKEEDGFNDVIKINLFIMMSVFNHSFFRVPICTDLLKQNMLKQCFMSLKYNFTYS